MVALLLGARIGANHSPLIAGGCPQPQHVETDVSLWCGNNRAPKGK